MSRSGGISVLSAGDDAHGQEACPPPRRLAPTQDACPREGRLQRARASAPLQPSAPRQTFRFTVSNISRTGQKLLPLRRAGRGVRNRCFLPGGRYTGRPIFALRGSNSGLHPGPGLRAGCITPLRAFRNRILTEALVAPLDGRIFFMIRLCLYIPLRRNESIFIHSPLGSFTVMSSQPPFTIGKGSPDSIFRRVNCAPSSSMRS